MAESWKGLVSRWTEAGLIDAAAAERIRSFEQARAGSSELRWPIWLALALGGLMVSAGVLLFVSALWDNLSPTARFVLVLVVVTLFHVTGATLTNRSRGLATTLHAVGTVSFGAGIFLCGQIFNLDEHWPSGLMLWAFGAAIAWALLRDWPQMALVAILTPAWLQSEWSVVSLGQGRVGLLIPATGAFLVALVYFTAVHPGHADVRRRVLMWIGGISLLPTALPLVFASSRFVNLGLASAPALDAGVRATGWAIAIGVPVIVAVLLRRAAAWPIAVAVVWVVALVNLHQIAGSVSLYVWWALGAVALAWWGVKDTQTERINMGSVILAATVLAFYFSQVMDKMGRSASLVGLGILCLGGGWALERGRRHLVRETRRGEPS